MSLTRDISSGSMLNLGVWSLASEGSRAPKKLGARERSSAAGATVLIRRSRKI